MRSLFLVLFLIFGCSKGPKPDVLQKILEAKSTQFQSGLLKLKDYSRRGSYGYQQDGERLLIYFKASFEITQDYQFSNWNTPGKGSLINLFGANNAGIKGISSEGNKKGDMLEVYGTQSFKRDSQGNWVESESMAQQTSKSPKKSEKFVSNLDKETQLDKKFELLHKAPLEKLELNLGKLNQNSLETQYFLQKLKDLAIETELAADRGKNIIGLASASEGGEYQIIAEAVSQVLNHKKNPVKSYRTRGSRHNLSLLNDQAVTLAIVQSDLLYQARNKYTNLRGVMALFPEAIQIVVKESSAIMSVSDLLGKKINIGPPGSGHEYSAKGLLRDLKIDSGQLTQTQHETVFALSELARERLDAVFISGAVPYPALVKFGKTTPFRILSLPAQIRENQVNPSQIQMTLAKGTYQNQKFPIKTLASTAILTTHIKFEDSKIRYFLEQLFSKRSEIEKLAPKASRFSRENWNKAMGIPPHPVSKEFFKRTKI